MNNNSGNVSISSDVRSNKPGTLSRRLQFLLIFLFTGLFFTFGANLSAAAATFTVTKFADSNDGVCDADCSLREAVAAANALASDDVIVFSSLFQSSQTISLGIGDLEVENNGTLFVDGPGAEFLTLDGNNLIRIFSLKSGTHVTLDGLTMTRGLGRGINIFGGGGCIYNTDGYLLISNSAISNCFSDGSRGGGIYNGGTLKLENSTLRNSSSYSNGGDNGGGIYNDVGTELEVSNSEITNNTAGERDGGGIYNRADVATSIINSTISNNSSNNGGGIYNDNGTLEISNSVFSNNSLSIFFTGGSGGAVRNSSGTVTIANSAFNSNTAPSGGGLSNLSSGEMSVSNSTFNYNSAIRGNGGGISNSGEITILNSDFSNNSAVTQESGIGGSGGGIVNGGVMSILGSGITNNTASRGGGLGNKNGTITIDNSLIATNSATVGGGICNGCEAFDSGGTVNVNNSTLSNNSSTLSGGGIYNTNFNTLNIVSSTISGNTSPRSGGIFVTDSGTASARNSIIADNVATSGTAPDFQGTLNSLGYNLIENINGTVITGTTAGIILGVDPQLLPLGNYGSTTQTVALKPSSPAIDAGDPNNFPAADQRGIPRPQDGNLDGTLLPDIGAYERQVTRFTVSAAADTNDGVCDSDCSLREAIFAANNASTPDNGIVFDASVFSTPQIITLTGGELVLANNGSLIIRGAGADLLTISGNNQSRVLSISNGATAAISGVTITGGNGSGAALSGFGGGILNNGGSFSAVNSVIKNNATPNFGGGIYNDNNGDIITDNLAFKDNSAGGNGGGVFINSGTGSITETTFSGNSSNSGGGGINNRGVLFLYRSTVNNNTAAFGGGGIVNSNHLSLINSTVSGNSINGAFGGGGIFNDSTGILRVLSSTIAVNVGNNGGGIRNNGEGTIDTFNSIIADNIDNSNVAPDFAGIIVSHGYNLIENTTGAVITGTTTGNITGIDPQLLPLNHNGGPTPTHSLHPASPAIDQGRSFGIITDQRGLSRPFDFPSAPNAADGSDIGAFERQITESGGQTPFDFDGDRKSDISIFRPASGEWWYLKSADGVTRAFQFGSSTDRIVPADYTGDGKTDLAVFRSSTGEWFVLRSEDNSFYSFPFGNSGDIPTPSDFDGDGIADPALFRPSTATWFIIRSSDNDTTITTFGADGDQPVAADYDGDGFADIAIFRPSTGAWWINRSSAGLIVTNFGTATDKTVQADYTGDGKADVAFFRPSTGEWFILRSEDFSFYSVPFGQAGDVPAPGDYDGDGAADYAVFRASNAIWYVQQSTNGSAAVSFGAAGDRPVPNAFVR